MKRKAKSPSGGGDSTPAQLRAEREALSLQILDLQARRADLSVRIREIERDTTTRAPGLKTAIRKA